jgi:hypothetical protein
MELFTWSVQLLGFCTPVRTGELGCERALFAPGDIIGGTKKIASTWGQPVKLSRLSSCTEILEWSSSAMVGKELRCSGLVRLS